jgi:hypothetical protein
MAVGELCRFLLQSIMIIAGSPTGHIWVGLAIGLKAYLVTREQVKGMWESEPFLIYPGGISEGKFHVDVTDGISEINDG